MTPADGVKDAAGQALREALAPLRSHADSAAVLLDIDGTLAPIVPRAEQAAVPRSTGSLLEALSRRYALVACVSGRQATEARRLVGVDSITYIGNHGLERLRPQATAPDAPPGLAEHASAIAEFAREAHSPALGALGITLEDKQAIWSFHWRQARDEERARAALERVALLAQERGLVPHWGRKVLEIRPALPFDKGTAIAQLVGEAGVREALYAGDDTTDLDAFRHLRELRVSGALDHAVCVGVRSDEAPPELEAQADLMVEGVAGVAGLLEQLAA